MKSYIVGLKALSLILIDRTGNAKAGSLVDGRLRVL